MQNQSYLKTKSRVNTFSSANIMTNMMTYFCHNGKTQVLENKFKGILFNRILTKKKMMNINNCINLFIETSLPYIKLKSKKGQKRRKTQKALLVRPIDRIASKRKAYINFSSLFKVTKHSSKPLILRLETEFESIYTHTTKQSQSSVNNHSLRDRRDDVHKSAYKYMPRS